MLEISAVFVVRNEAHRMYDALTAIRPLVDEIVVVDQQSGDGTREIATRLADVVIDDALRGYAEASFPLAFASASHEWVLLISPDESLCKTFARDLRALVRSDCLDSYCVRRKTYVGGRLIDDTPTTRLFRKDAVHVPTHLHSEPEPRDPSRVGRLPYVAIASYKSAREQDLDNERYAALMARGVKTTPS